MGIFYQPLPEVAGIDVIDDSEFKNERLAGFEFLILR